MLAFAVTFFLLLIGIAPSRAVLPLPTATCVTDKCSISLSSTSDYYSWTVPSGVTTINAVITGGGGGTGNWSNNERAPGGLGALLTETISVSAGDVLYFYVGGQGANGSLSTIGAGGTNVAGSGGGNGGSGGGAGGGAASEIRRNGTAVSDRIIVAAGGGGGGAGCGSITAATQDYDRGGSASGNTGENGYCTGYSNTNRGSGATILAAGNGGSNRNGSVPTSYGGGGGGGYFGGGAGYQGGGGAGSSWINATYVSGSFASAASNGPGSIVFSYPYVAPQITSINPGNGNFSYRIYSDISATSSVDGYVTFLADGKRIAGCMKIPTVVSVATCRFSASKHGSINVTALFYSTKIDISYIASRTVQLKVSGRSNTR